MFEKFRRSVARALTPAPQPRARKSAETKIEKKELPSVVRAASRWPVLKQQAAMRAYYNAAKDSRLTTGWGQASSNTSADAALNSDLRSLRARSRALIRDAAYAKRAQVIVVNNVVGSGIGMQAQVMGTRDKLREEVNAAIEYAWEQWSYGENCHTGGTLCFEDFERAVMGEVFEAGEVFIRKHYTAFGSMGVPYALELVEPERMADEYAMSVPNAMGNGVTLKLGVEVDRYYRPIAYWIRDRHPGDYIVGPGGTSETVRVPADQIIHLRIVDRWPQTRSAPWMHAVLRKLNDMDGYSEAEIIAARAAACYMGIISSEEPPNLDADSATTDGQPELELQAGVFERLGPGEKVDFLSPNRPNSAMEAFMRMMLREMAAGVGSSYESLSRDYSQSNYSSSRLALLDDRDLWRMLQGWFIRNFRSVVHREFLQQAVLAGRVPRVPLAEYATDPEKFNAVRFKPRGWGWIDPTKEVDAYIRAVRAGFTTVSDVIAKTGDGRDLEDVIRERERELKLLRGAGLVLDTDPEKTYQGQPVQEEEPQPAASGAPAQPAKLTVAK